MPPTLTIEQRDALDKASAVKIKEALQNLRNQFVSTRWLDTSNPYARDCIKMLIAHTLPGHSVSGNDLSQYIAVSAPHHCADGWTLLGRALDANARGDAGTAVHLAYYAELRAAMSLLATEGIGIFNDRHFVVTSSGSCSPIGKLDKQGRSNHGTHAMAWLALEYWAGLPRSADLFRCIIKPSGIPLGEWLDAFGGRSTSHPLAIKWLETWGLDLKRLSEDREARNQASYRPARLNHGVALRVLDCSDFIQKLWLLHEPSNQSRFDKLDRYLLRLSIDASFKALPKPAGRKLDDRLYTMLKFILSDDVLINQWMDFLRRIKQPDDPILTVEAAETASVGDPRHHLQVLSRAAMLLRVATGACAELLRSGPFGRTDLEFWWKPLGEERGLWAPDNEPTDLTELWRDINDAIEDIQQWEVTNGGAPVSHAQWRRDLAHQISVTGECERIALWGLGL